MLDTLWKRKGEEGLSSAPLKKKTIKKDKMKASALLPWSLVIGLEAPRASGATTQLRISSFFLTSQLDRMTLI